MKREYYDRDLWIFMVGMASGTTLLTIFLALKHFGYGTLAWIIMGSVSGMVCAAWGMSYILSKYHELDEMEFLEDCEPLTPSPAPSSLLLSNSADAGEVVTAGALTFPYATRALEAAQQATVKFWIDYDPERPPLQKSVQSFIAERGIPVRQAAELASAIKPDNVSDRSDASFGK